MDRITRNYISLAAAVLADAVKNVRRGNLRDALWLKVEGWAWWEMVTGERMDERYWGSWVDQGCPGSNLRIRSKDNNRREQRELVLR